MKKYKGTLIALLLVLVIAFMFIFKEKEKMSNIEYTFSIIKPDAVSRHLESEINEIFAQNGLEVVAFKPMTMTVEQASEFYAEHKGRPFYNSLVEYMTSGPVVVQVLKGQNAITKNREVMGATNPKDAAPGTIRAQFAESIDRNSVHGSDSPESAKREISMFFDYNEVTSK